jgi:intraflagellar transport protein 172
LFRYYYYLNNFTAKNRFRSFEITSSPIMQWVPGCDVIVCQSRKQLRIWYNMDAPDCSVDQDVQGVAVEIVRENEQSVVVMKDGNNFSGVPLDERRIQFTAALEQGNLSRATAFLEDCSTGPDIPAMWSKLGKASAMACELRLALKAFSAIEDVPKYRI